jgi:UDP-N-acetylglucosamine--dolichyl-phosphate N-acetylglucosaminephosphotransferase
MASAPTQAPRAVPKLLVFSVLPLAIWLLFRPLVDPVPALPALQASLGLSLIAFVASITLIPALGPVFVKAERWGYDLLKKDKIKVYVL